VTYLAQELAAWQLARDRRFVLGSTLGKDLGKRLLARKHARMRASPFAFLRGAAPLFYEILRLDPELAAGPGGRGWIVGDLHLENFGAYRREAPFGKTKEGRVVFGLNDYDDSVQAPFRWDMLRLTTSVILADRELGCDGVRAVELCRELVHAYVKSACHDVPAPRTSKPVRALLTQVESRTRTQLLDARTQIHRGARRFVHGERYIELPRELERQVPAALHTFAEGLDASARPSADQLTVVDAALRVAGTGSLGVVRIAALVTGHGGVDGGWIFDLKEEHSPAASALVKVKLEPNLRVLAGANALASHPSRQFGSSWLGDLPMLVRRLAPQEDKLDLRHLADLELPALVRSLGATVGEAHARAAGKSLPPWTAAASERMIDRALLMAGLHESVYLAWCKAIMR
jgi:uncharacterized protein (DUF2252 family)